jgi:hypothetical protein
MLGDSDIIDFCDSASARTAASSIRAVSLRLCLAQLPVPEVFDPDFPRLPQEVFDPDFRSRPSRRNTSCFTRPYCLGGANREVFFLKRAELFDVLVDLTNRLILTIPFPPVSVKLRLE